jgi:transcriptional regulator
MYLPPPFKIEEFEIIKDFLAAYPLGNIISFAEGSLQMNYIPFLLEIEGNKLVLTGHLAKANTQLESLKKNSVLVGFKGPDRYISPTWYESPYQVPTWNYAAVEIRGSVELIHDFAGIEDILSKSSVSFEKQNNTNWNYELPKEMRQALVKHIVGIKIHVEHLEAKFKLSQNRKPIDKAKVEGHLQNSASTVDQEMLRLMKLS